MPLGWHNQRYQDRLESMCLRRSLGEKDLEILVDKITRAQSMMLQQGRQIGS